MGEVTERVAIPYKLTFDAPFHFGTGLRRGLIHRTVAYNRQAYLYVPGSTLKGVLRDRCEQIARLFNLAAAEPHNIEDERYRIREARTQDPDIISRIFGSRFKPGQLYFDDAQMVAGAGDDEADDYIGRADFDSPESRGRYKRRQVESRTQVSLSRRGRTAQSGRLYTGEYGLRRLRFAGQIYGHLTDFSLEEKGTYSLLLLLVGLLSLNRLGGNKSSGAGRVTIELERLLIDGQPVEVDSILDQLPFLEYYPLEREEAQ